MSNTPSHVIIGGTVRQQKQCVQHLGINPRDALLVQHAHQLRGRELSGATVVVVAGTYAPSVDQDDITRALMLCGAQVPVHDDLM